MIDFYHSQLCYTARMAIKKKQKPHSSDRKKASASKSTSPRAKKAATKHPSQRGNQKATKKKDEEQERARKRMELTLRAFRMAYESNQRGEFHRL